MTEYEQISFHSPMHILVLLFSRNFRHSNNNGKKELLLLIKCPFFETYLSFFSNECVSWYDACMKVSKEHKRMD